MPGCVPRSRRPDASIGGARRLAKAAGFAVAPLLLLAALYLLAGGGRPARAQEQPDYRQALATSQAAIGRTLPAFRLTDSYGNAVNLGDYRGRPLVVSFIYTGCFQACPVATQFLARAVQQAREALGEDSFKVVSIGFNQPFDTPQAMGAFARQNRITDPRWGFLSPDAAAVAELTRAFGFTYAATPKGFDHVTQLTIVDARGVVYRQVYGENFEIQMLIQPLKELLSGQASEAPTLENMWRKVKLYCTVYDPASGRYRLDYSLFVEIFAGLTTLGAIAWLLLRELRRRPHA